MPALFSDINENECRASTVCLQSNCFAMKKQKIKEKLFIHAVKLVKHLVIQSCQAVSFRYIKNVFYEYKLWKHCLNPYLTIDHSKEKKDE